MVQSILTSHYIDRTHQKIIYIPGISNDIIGGHTLNSSGNPETSVDSNPLVQPQTISSSFGSTVLVDAMIVTVGLGFGMKMAVVRMGIQNLYL